jgi:hypothetical protein
MTIYTGKIRGDLTLRKGDDASKVTEVTGWLDISAEGAQLPVLTSVGGWLDISAEGAQLPVLTSVGGWLDISAEGAQLPVLTSVGGGLYISAEGAQLPVLTSVGGWLDISAEGAHLPVLTSVGGGLDIHAGKRFHAPQLREVAGKPIAAPEEAAALLRAVAEAATASPDALNMFEWHCGTSHCIAGWAVHLAPGGYELEAELEKKVGPDKKTLAAGNILLGAEASALFFLNNDDARSALHRVLDGKPAIEVAQ